MVVGLTLVGLIDRYFDRVFRRQSTRGSLVGLFQISFIDGTYVRFQSLLTGFGRVARGYMAPTNYFDVLGDLRGLHTDDQVKVVGVTWSVHSV